MMLSRRKIKEFFLMIEIALMVFLVTLAFVPISNALNLVNGIKNAANNSNMIYCISSPANPDSVYVNDIRDEIKKRCNVSPSVFETEAFSCNIQDEIEGYLILVSQDLYSDLKLDLDEGDLIDRHTEYMPVVISNHLTSKYNIGDVFECAANEKSVLCYVTGIFKKNSTMVDVNKQEGSELTAGAVGFNMAKYNGDFIIAVSNDSISISEDTIDSVMFSFPEKTDVDAIVNELNETYRNTYNFYSFSSLCNNSIRKSISDMEWRIVLLFLFAIVVLFNFVGYIIINTRQKQKVLSVMNICGMSFAKSVAINTISMIIIVLPAVIVGLWGSPNILINMDIEYYGFNFFVGLAIAIIFVSAIIGATLTSMWQRKNIDVINLYKKG